MNMIRGVLQSVVAIVLSVCAPAWATEIAVIVSAQSPIDSVAMHEVADVFLGKSTTLRNGMEAIPLDLQDGSKLRDDFYAIVTGKSPSLLKAHWYKLIFTGSGQPPKSLPSFAAMKKAVAGNPRYIGYIDAKEVDAQVKVVLVAR